MTTCMRDICGRETDGEHFCSGRCERLYSPTPRPSETLDHVEQRNRQRVIDNTVNQ